MRALSQFSISFNLILCLANVAVAQEGKPADASRSGVTITAFASNDRVRFTAPSSVVQIRLEVYNPTGKKLFDNEVRGGNVLDWHLQDGQAEPLADDFYLCVLTVKSLSGKLSQRIGSVIVEKTTANVQPVDVSRMTAQQVQAIGPIEENASLTVLKEDDNQTTTVIAHNGEDGLITRGRGALSFRIGDFFSGKDIEQMRLTPEGNLGIGITHPLVRLDVDGLVRASQGIVFPDGSIQYSAATKTFGAKSSLPDPSFQSLHSKSGKKGSGGQEHIEADGTGTQNFVAKWGETGGAGTLQNSSIFDDGFNLGVGTATPGGVFDLQRSSASDILQRLWNTGTGGAKLRYVASVGATSQVQLTDLNEWLMSMAGNNQIGMQFRVRAPSDPNTENGLAAAVRMTIARNGNVGIGTANPTQGKLQVEGGNSNGVVGNSSSGFGVFGASTQFEGVHGEALNINHGGVVGIHNGSGIGVYGASRGTGVEGESTSAAGFGGYFKSPAGGVPLGVEGYMAFNDIGTGKLSYIQSINGDLIFIPPSFHLANSSAMVIKDSTGNVGIGTSAPTARLSVFGAGAFNATGAARFDLYNTTRGDGYLQHVTDDGSWQIATINGAATRMLIDPAGNIRQLIPTVSGLVKAMLYVHSDGTLDECYNALTGASASGNTTADACGFHVTHTDLGIYDIAFGFFVADRFYAVTAKHEFVPCAPNCNMELNKGANFNFLGDGNSIRVLTFYTDQRTDRTNAAFMLIVY
jgi:hypothetical protein